MKMRTYLASNNFKAPVGSIFRLSLNAFRVESIPYPKHYSILLAYDQNILLGVNDQDDKKKIIEYDFELNTMKLRNYLEKLRIQDTNENEYEWKYYDDIEYPEFIYQNIRSFNWNNKTNITTNDKALISKYLDHEITIDSIDLYLYVLKLESTVDGNMNTIILRTQQLLALTYVYVHHP